MRSASSMQTPPPTSTSASKRKAQQAQVAQLVKESAANGVRKTTPLFPKPSNAVAKSPAEASPQQFSTVQFSPEVFGSFQMGGPATAPVYPHQKLFWDPTAEANAMNIDFDPSNTFVDSFGLGNSKHMESFATNNDTMAMSHLATSSFDLGNVMGLSMTSSTPQNTNYLSSAGLITNGSASKLSNTVVDPSLLFSSPNRASEQMNMDSSHQANFNENMRPYAHQMKEAERERENSETRKPKRRRGPQNDSPAVKAALQVLRGEEDEDSSQRSSSRNSMSANPLPKRVNSNRVTFEEVAHPPASLQRRRSSHRSGVARRPSRRTVTLTIGPDGRAKTETKIVAESAQGTAMDVDNDSGDTESLSSIEDAQMAISQPSSFAAPINITLPKNIGRFGSSSNLHSHKSSYASTRSNLIDPALTTTFINEPLGGSQDHDSDGEAALDSADEKGDAQSELKKMRARRRASGQLPGSGPIPGNHPPFAKDALVPGPALITPTQDLFNNISPTTITDPDLATPSTGDASTISSNATRCVCRGHDSKGGLMIMW